MPHSKPPKGETKYLNYNPDEIETVADAVELFEWLREENQFEGNQIAASVFEEVAEFLQNELVNDD